MTKHFFKDGYDFHFNTLKDARLAGVFLENENEDPEYPQPGQMYFSTISNLIKFFDGTSWHALDSSGVGLTAIVMNGHPVPTEEGVANLGTVITSLDNYVTQDDLTLALKTKSKVTPRMEQEIGATFIRGLKIDENIYNIKSDGIVGVKMNGMLVPVTDNIADLGEVLTEHQDISGKLDRIKTLETKKSIVENTGNIISMTFYENNEITAEMAVYNHEWAVGVRDIDKIAKITLNKNGAYLQLDAEIAGQITGAQALVRKDLLDTKSTVKVSKTGTSEEVGRYITVDDEEWMFPIVDPGVVKIIMNGEEVPLYDGIADLGTVITDVSDKVNITKKTLHPSTGKEMSSNIDNTGMGVRMSIAIENLVKSIYQQYDDNMSLRVTDNVGNTKSLVINTDGVYIQRNSEVLTPVQPEQRVVRWDDMVAYIAEKMEEIKGKYQTKITHGTAEPTGGEPGDVYIQISE